MASAAFSTHGRARLPGRLIVLAPLFAVVFACRAESPALHVEAPGLPLSCLSVPSAGNSLQYPADTSGQLNAVVRVEMTFASGEASPRVKTLSNSGDPAFEAVVVKHVAAYRLPCLEPGRSVTLQQTFDFMGVKPADVRALAFSARYALLDELGQRGCTVQGLEGQPEYPSGLRGPAPPGSVVIKVRFPAPDEPPAVSVLFDGGDSRLAKAVLEVVNKYRLRCQAPLSEPVVATQTFEFVLPGRATLTLRESFALAQLLRSTSNFDQQKVRFDLSAMGCPFDVVFTPYQPFADNSVEADLARHPERGEFVQWMRQLVLDVPPRALPTVIGKSTTVSVPCALIDMT